MGNVLEYIKIVFASHFMRSIMHLINLNLMKKIVYIQFNYCLQLITILWHYYKLHILYFFFFKEIKTKMSKTMAWQMSLFHDHDGQDALYMVHAPIQNVWEVICYRRMHHMIWLMLCMGFTENRDRLNCFKLVLMYLV